MKTIPKTVEVPTELLMSFDALLRQMSQMQGTVESLLLSKDKRFMARIKKAEEEIAKGKVQDWDEFLKNINWSSSN